MGEQRRTIIDLLKKGNQELFHSSMIAWLLDPGGEHGLGRQFLDGLAGRCPALRDVADGAQSIRVRTEVGKGKSRYDIELDCDGKKVIIENKTKSIGRAAQLDKYDRQGRILLALGFCKESFQHEEVDGTLFALGRQGDDGSPKRYPLITYGDVLSVLKGIDVKHDDPFRMLVDQYRCYLRRELEILRLIGEFGEGDLDRHRVLRERVSERLHNQNDIRFWNRYFLERLRRHLSSSCRWGRAGYKSNKNMASGSWLAIFDLALSRYEFDDAMRLSGSTDSADMYFHIAFAPGLFTDSIDDTAGMLQLRCNKSVSRSNKELLAAFKQLDCALPEGAGYARKPADTYKSFTLVQQDLKTRELPYCQFEQRLSRFAGIFGHFKASGA